MKAKFGNKKDYLTVAKHGCLMLEFIPLGNENQIDNFNGNNFRWNEKQNFVLDPKKCAQLLMIDSKIKENFKFSFKYTKDNNKKSLGVESNWEKGGINIFFQNIVSDINTSHSTLVPTVDLLLIQKMIDYSLPYMMGWNILDNSKVSPEDIIKL